MSTISDAHTDPWTPTNRSLQTGSFLYVTPKRLDGIAPGQRQSFRVRHDSNGLPTRQLRNYICRNDTVPKKGTASHTRTSLVRMLSTNYGFRTAAFGAAVEERATDRVGAHFNSVRNWWAAVARPFPDDDRELHLGYFKVLRQYIYQCQ